MKAIIYFGLFLILFASCTKDKVAEPIVCDSDVSYSAEIQPLLQMNCAVVGCHDAAALSGGYDWSSLSVVQANSVKMLNAMKHNPGVIPMPFMSTQLADSLISKFECWVVQGSLNN